MVKKRSVHINHIVEIPRDPYYIPNYSLVDILNTLDNQSIDINGASTAQTEPQINAVLTALMNASSPSSPTHMQSPVFTQGSQQNLQYKSAPKPFINIVEQPATKPLKFRYKSECEGRSAGSIPGLNSTPENKTYPTIEIVGYKGDVVIVVSCVTKDPPYRQHPHYLVGKDGCKDGICTLVLSGEPLQAVFSNLGIQCVKKNDIKAALEVRERLQVDPFKTKFGHKDQPASIDLNVVRLCFQAFLKTESGVKPLQPVVSEPVFDKKAMSDLVICRLCCCSAKVGGGDEIILLCEKIAKNDIKTIKIRFYELNNDNQLVWEDFAKFRPADIHKQTAITFKTPPYHNQDVLEKAKVFIQLVRPSDGVQSESIPFEYHPDPDQIKRKRLKTGGNPMNILRRELQKYEKQQNAQFQNDIKDICKFFPFYFSFIYFCTLHPTKQVDHLNFI
ncbi:embryonic polarity protein dorsal-like [Teleopsis dalmanni]|uniref:embryonic polarity protein dorsal-like n=1 Tax=Teleopsis dalmanni TaxID=139649 RepID=UPI0018CE385D|nr:embryonic polarity protein dorsal-like [Teleopsis dalmanni]